MKPFVLLFVRVFDINSVVENTASKQSGEGDEINYMFLRCHKSSAEHKAKSIPHQTLPRE